MSAALRLREDYGAPELRALARASRDADQTRRLLALAAIYEGASRGAAAEIGGVQRQTVRDWVAAFNGHGPSGLIDGKAPGQRPLLNPEQRQVLKRIVEAGPDPAVDGVVRWRLIDLAQWIFTEFSIAISKQTLSRMLRQMGYRKLSARPRHHAQEGPRRAGDFQKAFAARLAEIARGDAAGRPIEVWFADEARIGQKNKITRRWARRGTRPAAPRDQRTASAYIFGAICPGQGKGAALVLPRCNSAAMTLHLAEIARTVTPGAHAVLMLDQAGWHLSDKLVVPANITLLPLPPKCPELNPVENVWQYLRENWLSNRIFRSQGDILDHCCHAWNRLTAQPWTIMSIGLRAWAHGF